MRPNLFATATEEIEAHSLHVFPGLIDVHVHFNDPGRADWEGASTGSSALAAGGGTCFFDMPLNSSPPVLDAASFDAKLNALSEKSYTDFALWGGLTPQSLDHMDELAARGVVGFKAFMCDSGIADFDRADDFTLVPGMMKAAKLGLPVIVHTENQELVAGKTEWLRQRLPVLTAKDWPHTRPPLAEADAIQRALLIARFTKCKLHIVHISNRYCTSKSLTDTAGLSISPSKPVRIISLSPPMTLSALGPPPSVLLPFAPPRTAISFGIASPTR